VILTLAPETYSYVRVLNDAVQVAYAAADRLIEFERAALEMPPRFGVALAGGSNPERIYELLATEEQVALRPASGNDEFDPYC
jgi:6-phosphogluconolactonase/glucosamine-6-phosphate isomerase/deaminase